MKMAKSAMAMINKMLFQNFKPVPPRHRETANMKLRNHHYHLEEQIATTS
jgi:hypothetical protein